MIILVTNWMVMQPPPVMCTLAPRPSMVLKLFMISSCFRVIFMLLEKTIHRGSSWMTAWRRVPGLGSAGLPSEESVTT
ncbi:unnamed protein product [Spirodela intermedia]|uniref:Uncharacterized protein n=2 Tax=Spirodela intermedia TaxID=51605 RepID=A0A7I8KND0_SPIIN|nr:unnamed protein product [Spirodela intermedia]CAA6662587.1 unnamed protein product [Spirodela intermedia]CAA7398992.1 unnamed protein product [Spirodela intermedia]